MKGRAGETSGARYTITMISTATGPIEPERLGRVLCHEHIATRIPGVAENWPGTFPRNEVIDTCVEVLRSVRQSGIGAVVDHTTFDIGRDPHLLAAVSQASGMTIVATTGVWVKVPRFFDAISATEMADLFVSDITNGIAGSDVRAAIVKVCLEVLEPTPLDLKAIKAAAIVQRRTGVSITTHTSVRTQSGITLLDCLAANGADLSRVLVGHAGDTTDLDYLTAVLQTGCFVGLDRFGVQALLPDEDRIATVAELVRRGWASQLMLSQDASCWSGWRTPAQRLKQHPHWDMARLGNHILPALREAGVTDADIDTMTIHNPRRFLTPT